MKSAIKGHLQVRDILAGDIPMQDFSIPFKNENQIIAEYGSIAIYMEYKLG